jgi:hypothetical protein
MKGQVRCPELVDFVLHAGQLGAQPLALLVSLLEMGNMSPVAFFSIAMHLNETR